MGILVCDSGEEAVQQALRAAVEEASSLRHERIAVVGCAGADVQALTARAAALNSERVVLVGPDALESPCPASSPRRRWRPWPRRAGTRRSP